MLNLPISANNVMAKSPLVMPPSTLRHFRSVFESSFILSRTALVWKAFASSTAQARCQGLVHCDIPAFSIHEHIIRSTSNNECTNKQTSGIGVPVGSEQTGKGGHKVYPTSIRYCLCKGINLGNA